MRQGVEPEHRARGSPVSMATSAMECLDDHGCDYHRQMVILPRSMEEICRKATVTAPMHLLAIYIRRNSVLSQLPHNLLVPPSPGKYSPQRLGPVISSMSQGNTTKASKCSTPAILKMSNDNGPSEMGVVQPMVVGRKLLPPIVPGDEPIFVCEKQHAAILRLRERRLRIKEARERRLLEAKKHRPRGPNGRFVPIKGDQEGPNGGSNQYQPVTTVDGEAQSSTPLGFYWYVFTTSEGGESSTPAGIGFYYPFTTTNGGENVGDMASGSEVPSSNAPSGFFWPVIMASGYEENINPAGYFCWPVVVTDECGEDIGESAYGSQAPIRNPAGDFSCPVVATNDDEEHVGEVAYNSILNLESPDPTDLLRIMMGNKYSTDEVSEQFQNVARLQAPDFATLLTVMNNAGYDPAADHGPYDVDKVMTKLEGW